MIEKQYTPKGDGFYMPGEYEQHDGCIIVWPQRPGSWSFGASAACEPFTAVIKAISPSQHVYVICGKEHWGKVWNLAGNPNAL